MGQPTITIRRGEYFAYTPDVDDDLAHQLFEQRFGYPPAEIFLAGTVRLAGPIGVDGSRPQQLTLIQPTERISR
jgi:hypothetical protein